MNKEDIAATFYLIGAIISGYFHWIYLPLSHSGVEVLGKILFVIFASVTWPISDLYLLLMWLDTIKI